MFANKLHGGLFAIRQFDGYLVYSRRGLCFYTNTSITHLIHLKIVCRQRRWGPKSIRRTKSNGNRLCSALVVQIYLSSLNWLDKYHNSVLTYMFLKYSVISSENKPNLHMYKIPAHYHITLKIVLDHCHYFLLLSYAVDDKFRINTYKSSRLSSNNLPQNIYKYSTVPLLSIPG